MGIRLRLLIISTVLAFTAICMPYIPPTIVNTARLVVRHKPFNLHRSIPVRAAGISLPFAFFSSSSSTQSEGASNNMGAEGSLPGAKSEGEWQAVLSKEQFRIIRQKGTERPGSHAYDKKSASDAGVYHCAACDAPLYTSNTKFASGCGWPAFFDTVPGAVKRHEDKSMFMTRIEITCANCGGHLGHLFSNENYDTPTNQRHCVNGVSLTFKEAKE